MALCVPPPIDCGGVPRSGTIRHHSPSSRMKTPILLILVACVAAIVGARLANSLQGTDFPDFYCAARMLLDGHGHQLYDAVLQREYQAHYAGRVGTLYIHPPFEAVLYLVAAWLPLRRAYRLWSFLNVAVLGAGMVRLSKHALQPWDWRILLAASLTFIPVLLCLLQGQDSLLLLLLVILAFTDLRRGRPFTAGCWLGLGLFKFQIVLPVILVLVLTQSGMRKALAKGFSLVALAFAGLSAAISGWPVFGVYPKFILHLPAEKFAGVFPVAMANFRGLTYMVFHGDHSARTAAAISILSLATLTKTLAVWKHTWLASDQRLTSATHEEFDLAFANTVIFSLLVSYHLNPHDLALLLLPISVLLHHTLARNRLPGPRAWATLGLLATLFLPPLQLWTLKTGTYALIALPILFLFLMGPTVSNRSNGRSSEAPHTTLHIRKDQREN